MTAVVVAKPGREVSAEEILAHCRERLAAFKVPKFVRLAEALPKNPSDKILKRELREIYRGVAAEPTGESGGYI
ncbi:hypothetical protein [Streptomyces sp. NPDC094472]|uniref:AMP-binding enzyme n=1 Tax=unclassified Streptomyces TaxID=2593676 RepID=UPI0033286506